MMERIIFIVGMFATLSVYAQSNKGSKYIYIQVYSDQQLQTLDTDQSLALNSKKEDIFKEVEAGMYRIDKPCRLKILEIYLGHQKVKLPLKRYRKNKFFNIKIFIPTHNEAEQSIIEIRRGDAITTIDNCELDECNIIMVEFPQIVTINGEIKTTVNNKFEKYVFK